MKSIEEILKDGMPVCPKCEGLHFFITDPPRCMACGSDMEIIMII